MPKGESPNSQKNIQSFCQFKWKAGKTVRITVPILLRDQIMAYTKELDEQYAQQQMTNNTQ